MTMLLNRVQDWYCPACGLTDETVNAPNRYHPCPKMHGMATPMVHKGVAAKLEAVERQDYVGNDLVQTDDRGRPVMSIVTTRDDGQDVIVFAPTAVLRAG